MGETGFGSQGYDEDARGQPEETRGERGVRSIGEGEKGKVESFTDAAAHNSSDICDQACGRECCSQEYVHFGWGGFWITGQARLFFSISGSVGFCTSAFAVIRSSLRFYIGAFCSTVGLNACHQLDSLRWRLEACHYE